MRHFVSTAVNCPLRQMPQELPRALLLSAPQHEHLSRWLDRETTTTEISRCPATTTSRTLTTFSVTPLAWRTLVLREKICKRTVGTRRTVHQTCHIIRSRRTTSVRGERETAGPATRKGEGRGRTAAASTMFYIVSLLSSRVAAYLACAPVPMCPREGIMYHVYKCMLLLLYGRIFVFQTVGSTVRLYIYIIIQQDFEAQTAVLVAGTPHDIM